MTVETASEEGAADNAALDLPWASAERIDECPDDTVHLRLLRFSRYWEGHETRHQQPERADHDRS